MRVLPRVLPGWLIAGATCVIGAVVAGRASEKVTQALRESLPRYDPGQRAAAERERESADKAKDRSPVLNAPAPPLPAATVVAPPGAAPANDSAIVQLEPFTVRGSRLPPAVKLPRMIVASPAGGPDTADPFLTPAERARRLTRKHFNVLTMLLNPPFLGGGALAGESEQRLRYAGELNDVADKIELAAAAGATAEDLKALRELYLQLYMARPKN